MSKLINEVIKVDSCHTCPLYGFQYDCRVAEGMVFDENAIDHIYGHKKYLHPDCPLKRGKIMFELIKE